MPHMLETDDDGTTYFADSRSDAWHQLGQQFGRVMTAEELMTESHLGGWDVRKEPVLVNLLQQDGVETAEVPGKYAIVRTNPTSHKAEATGGVVGEWYKPIQNEANCDVLQAIVDESGAVFETAGSLNSGRNTFVTMKLPKLIKVGGVDDIELNIAALNSHDGTSRFRILTTPTRIVCANTQAAALRNAKSEFAITHTSNSTQRIEEARAALRLTFEYAAEFEAEAEAMIAKQMSKDQFVRMCRSLWAKPTEVEGKSSSKMTIFTNREGALIDLFTKADTQENIRNTAWAGYQSIVEYLDHGQRVQQRGFASVADARASRSIMGAFDKTKILAFDKAKAFASR